MGSNEEVINNNNTSNQQGQKVAIKFTNNKDGGTFYCTVKTNISFRRVMKTYTDYHGLQEGSVRFIYEGSKILPNLTPEDINFPDGGEVDVMAEVSGGGWLHLRRARNSSL